MPVPNPNDEPNVLRAHGHEGPPNPGNLPPRMRERLEARERKARGGGPGGPVITLLILLLLVVAGGLVWWRSYNSAGNVAKNSAEPTAAAPDHTSTSFGIAVGHFASEDAALGERDRLTGTTHLPVSIGQVAGGGATEFQVILGSYHTRAEAESVGHSLEQGSIVKDWQVVPLSQSL